MISVLSVEEKTYILKKVIERSCKEYSHRIGIFKLIKRSYKELTINQSRTPWRQVVGTFYVLHGTFRLSQ